MENASKALLIAGAILIVILLIAVGMLVYSKSRSVIDTGIAQMSSTEISMFNAQFDEYSGDQKGTSVKSLLQAVIANNQTYATDTAKQVTINSKTEAADISALLTAIKPSSTYTVTFTYTEGLIKTISYSEKT